MVVIFVFLDKRKKILWIVLFLKFVLKGIEFFIKDVNVFISFDEI